MRRKRARTWGFASLFLLAAIGAAFVAFNLARRYVAPEVVLPEHLNLLALVRDKEQGGHSRSDTLLLVQVDRKTGRAQAVQIPRDSLVDIPGHGHAKINAAFTYGGAKLAVQTVEQALRIKVDHYVAVDMEMAAQMVDAIGGVEMEVERDMEYVDNAQALHINLRQGQQRLSGQQFVGYCRWRGDHLGDLGRLKRQQRALQILFTQLCRPEQLPHYPRLAQIAAHGTETTLGARELLALAQTLKQIGPGRLMATSLPQLPEELAAEYIRSTNVRRASYVVIDDKAARQLVGGASDPLEVRVLNGNGLRGSARAAAERLEPEVHVVGLGDADHDAYPETVIRVPEDCPEPAANALRQRLGCGRVERGEWEQPVVIVGRDFDAGA